MELATIVILIYEDDFLMARFIAWKYFIYDFYFPYLRSAKIVFFYTMSKQKNK